MGNNDFWKLIIEHSSVGYSYNRMIYDDNGQLKDYEFIKVNKAYELMVGIEEKDLIGKRISQIYKFAKKQQMDWNEFFRNIINKHNKKEFEYYFETINKSYRVKTHRAEKDYIINSLTDITEEQNQIKEQILYSSMEFTHELLTNNDQDRALFNGMDMLGNATGVDRVYYWENHYDEDSKRLLTSQKFEWSLDEVKQEKYNLKLQNIPFEESGKFIIPFSKNKPFSFHIKDMYDGKNDTKEVFKSQGVHSVLTIPIFLKDDFIGFMGFGSCNIEKEWSQIEISLLNSFILLYVKILEKNLIEKHVFQVNENFNNFFNMVKDLLFVLDLEFNIIDVNDNVLSRLNYSKEELLGKSAFMLYPKDEIEEVKKNVEELTMKKNEYFNIPAITKDGYVFPLEMNVSEGIWNGKPVIFAVGKDRSELSISEEKFSKVFNDSGVSMFITKFDDGEILDANDSFLEFIGYTSKELIGKSTLNLQITKDYENREKIKNKIETYKKISDLKINFIRKDKEARIGLTNIVPLNINNKRCLVTSIIDITDRVEYEAELLEKSNRDFLTGIYNRNFVYKRMEEKIEEYKRVNKSFSLAIIDIDDFKLVNDKYGHQVGDYVLIEFAKIINDSLRSYDILGRYGGEEFIVIFNHSNREKSNIVLERILNMIRNKVFKFNLNQIKVTFSAGISSCEELGKDEISIDKLVDIADKRMYYAKKDGKNKIVYKD